MPPDSEERIALSMTVLLAFSVILFVVNQLTPASSDSTPVIGIYCTCVCSVKLPAACKVCETVRRPSVCLSVCLPVSMSVCLSLCLSLCLLISLFLFVSLSVSLSACLPVCLTVCLSVCPSHHSHAAAAGLLLSAVPAGDIDRQRRAPSSSGATARRSAANADSVMLTTEG